MSDWVMVNDDVQSIDMDLALNDVSSERRVHALGYRFERDRRLSVAAYLLLKEALRRGYGITENPRLARSANGKPFLPDHPDIHFNLSHCPKAAVCIVSDRPVGIDVEEIGPVDWDVARRVLSPAELAGVRASSEPEVTFARHWTRKEAFVKMTGAGIAGESLPDLLPRATDCAFETTLNVARGYVFTAASKAMRPDTPGLIRCGEAPTFLADARTMNLAPPWK